MSHNDLPAVDVELYADEWLEIGRAARQHGPYDVVPVLRHAVRPSMHSDRTACGLVPVQVRLPLVSARELARVAVHEFSAGPFDDPDPTFVAGTRLWARLPNSN